MYVIHVTQSLERFFLVTIFSDYCAYEFCEKAQDVKHKGERS